MDSLGSIGKPLVIGGAFILLICGAILFLFFVTIFSFDPPTPIQKENDESSGQKNISNEVKYAKHINKAAAKYDLSPALIAAVIKQESDFDPNATSTKGAIGLMQVMPDTASELGVKDPLDPAQNIMGGAKYLRKMLDMFGGNLELSIAAYNAGPGNVKKYGGIPPISETQKYVPNVLGNMKRYEKMVKKNKLVIPDFNGTFSWPTHPSVAPGCGIHCYAGHTGQDFPAPLGTPIYAAGDGVIQKVETPMTNPRLGPQKSYGTYIQIDHGNGMSTLYAHMRPGDIQVMAGEKVKKGQQIGLIGSYGNSSGPHLHFEVRKNNKPQDPMKYLKN